MHGQPAVHALPLTMHDTPSDRVAALFDTHHSRLYRLARRLSGSADDALDLVQETFLRAARDPGAVPAGAGAEEAWLVRVLVNLQRDTWRHAEVRHRHASHLPHPAGATPDPEGAAVARVTVWRALDRLAPRRRAVVILRELDGLDTGRIASVLGISRVTVRWHLARAHRELARLLADDTGGTHAHR